MKESENLEKLKNINAFVNSLRHNFKTSFVETGVAAIDEHHLGLMEIIESLAENLLKLEINKTEIKSLLNRLIAYSLEHFEHEEKLMRQSRYVHWEWHQKQHQTFNKRLNRFLGQLNNDVDLNTYSLALTEWLTDWFSSHLLEEDKKMSLFLRRNTKEKRFILILLASLIIGEVLIVLTLFRFL